MIFSIALYNFFKQQQGAIRLRNYESKKRNFNKNCYRTFKTTYFLEIFFIKVSANFLLIFCRFLLFYFFSWIYCASIFFHYYCYVFFFLRISLEDTWRKFNDFNYLISSSPFLPRILSTSSDICYTY